MTTPDQEPEKNEPISEKNEPLSDKFESLKRNEKIDGIMSYASSNTRDILAYILMIVGIVLLFTHSFYGGLVIGLILGLYFTKEVAEIFSSLNEFIENQGMVRSLILGGFVLALFVSAPAIFIGIAIAIAVRQILHPEGLNK